MGFVRFGRQGAEIFARYRRASVTLPYPAIIRRIAMNIREVHSLIRYRTHLDNPSERDPIDDVDGMIAVDEDDADRQLIVRTHT